MIVLLNYLKIGILGIILCFVPVHSNSTNEGYVAQLHRNLDICSITSNGHRLYLELGDAGYLRASNVTVPNVSSFW